MSRAWQAVVGLEVHVQLATAAKLFGPERNTFGAEPNSEVSAVCAGLPGALPVINREAIELCLRAGLALGGELQPVSRFARKHYFYPDLPKGYQISQYEQPIFLGGRVRFPLGDGWEECRLRRVHIEEDAGKLIHGGASSLVDLNRAGVPLIEVVTEPDLRAAASAGAFLRHVRQLLRHLEVSDCNMEEGSLRCDANVSLRRADGSEATDRTEIKNMNSFRFVERAIQCEIERQLRIVGEGGRVVQQTRLYDEASGKTHPMRGKEEAEDYRYFPDPDLPPVRISKEWEERARRRLPELPGVAQERYERQLGLPRDLASQLVARPGVSEYFDAAVAAGGGPATSAKLLVNHLLPQARGRDCGVAELGIAPRELGELARRVDDGRARKSVARQAFEKALETGGSLLAVLKEREALADSAAVGLDSLIQATLAENPSQVEEYRAGRTKVLGFFVGRVLKAAGRGADPREIKQALEQALRAGPGE